MDLKMSLLCIHEPLSKRATTGKLSASFAGSAQYPKSKPQVRKDLHVYSTPDCEES